MIIQYLKANSEYSLTLLASFVICAIIIALIAFFYKKSKSNIANELPKNDEICKNLVKNSNISLTPLDNEQSTISQNENCTPDCKQQRKCEKLHLSAEIPPVTIKADWVIHQNNGEFFAQLASENECFLQTEIYTSLSGIKSAIETLKNNIQAENFAIDLNGEGEFIFKIFSTAKRLLCISKGYPTIEQCKGAFYKINELSKNAKINTLTSQ